MRIFPVSLQDLSEIMVVGGKLGKYRKIFNTFKLFRFTYYGGATDHYKLRGKKIKWYDINSLYPKAMLKPMPYKPIKFHKDLTNTKLENFFGFCLAKIETPTNLINPILPYRKYTGELIFPLGNWIGVYFSEELKKAASCGYKINMIEGWEFSKIFLFEKYVEHFFDLKKNAKTPADKFIAKMQLNQLYGYFGRSRELILTKFVNYNELTDLIKTCVIRNIIEIDDDNYIVSLTCNINWKILRQLNMTLEDIQVDSVGKSVKSNVAISAAITAYARMLMADFKMNPNVYYTDTDSIFTDKELDEIFVGDELGLMKDEMKGVSIDGFIDEAIFLGNKQYIVKYRKLDPDTGEIKQVVVSKYSGIKRDSLTWEQFERLAKGEVLKIKTKNRFIRSHKHLNMRITSRTLNISNAHSKNLIGNIYQAPVVFDSLNPFDKKSKLIINLANRFKFLFKKYITIPNLK